MLLHLLKTLQKVQQNKDKKKKLNQSDPLGLEVFLCETNDQIHQTHEER